MTPPTDRNLEALRADLRLLKHDTLTSLRTLTEAVGALTTDQRETKTSIDHYLQLSEARNQEQLIVKARLDRLVHVLVDKHIVTSDEIDLLAGDSNHHRSTA